MNRADQLKDALESCLACNLPTDTEFIIIDNASNDNTENTVKTLMNSYKCNYYYEKLPENLGVGGGRNYAFSKSRGEYIYALDDDAVIDFEYDAEFFNKATAILDKNPNIITLTTQIYDTAWKRNRIEKYGKAINDNLYSCIMFCGGSHFIRRSFFTDVPYLPNKYGFEEIPPSLYVINAKKYNAFSPDLLVIHKPKNNKWDHSNGKNAELLINELAISFALKSMLYPTIMFPLLVLANFVRRKKHLKNISNAKQKLQIITREFKNNYPISRKIKLSSVCRIIFDFGIRGL